MKKLIITFYLALSLLTTSHVVAQKESTDALLDSIALIMQQKEIPGMYISVVSADAVLLETGLGYADQEHQVKVTNQSLFRIGSISKTFTALAVLSLIEEQRLTLETPLREIAPEVPFKNEWESTRPVRIKHLLEHKAGFDEMHFNVLTGNRKPGMTAFEEVLAVANSLESRWEPGLVHSYSNPGYVVLGYIIEKLTKMPYQQYIQTKVLQKLEMNDTHFISEDGDYRDLTYSKGYSTVEKEVEQVAIIGESAGSLLSHASDMSKFLQFLLNPELQDSSNIVSASFIHEMGKLHSWFEEDNQVTWGYGLGMYDRRYGSGEYAFKGHNGGIPGFVSDYVFSKELDLGIMISTNTEVSNRKVIDLLVNHFAQGKQPDPVSTITMEVSSDWDGEYRLVNERNEIFRLFNFPVRTMTVKATGDSLMMQIFGGSPLYYHPVSDRAFSRKKAQIPSLFLGYCDGVPVVYQGDQMMVATSNIGFGLLRVILVTTFVCALLLIVVLIIRWTGSFFLSKWKKGLRLMLYTLLPALLFVLSLLLLLSPTTMTEIASLARISITSVSIFMMSILGPLALVLSIVRGVRYHWKGFALWQKIFYGISWVATFSFVIYCFSFDWFAVALWSY